MQGNRLFNRLMINRLFLLSDLYVYSAPFAFFYRCFSNAKNAKNTKGRKGYDPKL
jgi:hypothetical protein